MAKRSASERAARALCARDGHPENIRFEGAPMWKSYLPQVRVVIEAMKDPGMEHGSEWIRIVAALVRETE